MNIFLIIIITMIIILIVIMISAHLCCSEDRVSLLGEVDWSSDGRNNERKSLQFTGHH